MSRVTILMTLILSGCFSDTHIAEYGPRHSWPVDSDNGGAFVYMEDDDNKVDNVYRGIIYNKKNKKVIYVGRFLYSKNGKLNFRNRKSYERWDGENLHFRDHSFLRAIDIRGS